MKVPNFIKLKGFVQVSLSRLQNEGSQLRTLTRWIIRKSIKATE